jgi:hypothetical protein
MTLTRRQFVASAPVALGATSLLSACTPGDGADDYAALARAIRPADAPIATGEGALRLELVRQATLAPSSHNTQCWTFSLEPGAIVIRPDLSRRCPAVDPDDHHLFVSLGCAVENLVHASLAEGLSAEPRFDVRTGSIRVALTPARATASALCRAIPLRQSTRGDYDGKPVSREEIGILERAGTSDNVRMVVMTEPRAVERVLDYVIHANSLQIADKAFVAELKSWIRFNGREAARRRDGLYTATTGNLNLPTWLGELAFGWFYTPASENDKCARQIRSSAGVAVLVGQDAEKATWVDVGRCYERFALQATALGIRTALINQPVEVQPVRPEFAAAIGLRDLRPDLVVRFGRGSAMPYSLRRPVREVLTPAG